MIAFDGTTARSKSFAAAGVMSRRLQRQLGRGVQEPKLVRQPFRLRINITAECSRAITISLLAARAERCGASRIGHRRSRTQGPSCALAAGRGRGCKARFADAPA